MSMAAMPFDSDVPDFVFASMGELEEQLPTPSAIVDLGVVRTNIATMNQHLNRLGSAIRFRPHVKTHKSGRIAAMQVAGHFGGITVSTLAEAKYFFALGFTDILYAVGMVGRKVDSIAQEVRRGLKLSVIADSVTAVEQIAARCDACAIALSVLIDVDCGYYRTGLDVEGDELLRVAESISAHASCLTLSGVITHGGHSYGARGEAELERIANQERDAAVRAATRLRDTGFSCDVVSIGSTPTAYFLRDATGVTEVRAGVYAFQDLDQMGIGCCGEEHIALTVLSAVIGHQPPAGKVLVDAGGLALSKDTSAAQHISMEAGLGVIVGRPPYRVVAVSQEHGHIKVKPTMTGSHAVDYDSFPIGSSVRILPNHACFTAAAFDAYYVFERSRTESGDEVKVWREARVNGW